MKRANSVDSYIQQARLAGELGSEGFFTIAAGAALEKLAAFQLPRSAAWVLKPVQAAVAGEAPEIRIKQTTYQTFFEYSPLQAICPEEFHAGLITPGLQVSGPVAHVIVGIRAVGFGEKRPFKVGLVRGLQCDLFSWDGKTLTRQTLALETQAAPQVQVEVAFPPQERKGLLGPGAALTALISREAQELVLAAQACPIGVSLDGRRLDTLSAGLGDPRNCSSLVAVGMAEHDESFHQPALKVPGGVMGGKFLKRKVLTDGFSGRANRERVEALALFRLVLHLKPELQDGNTIHRPVSYPSRCHLLKDGVICDMTHLHLVPSCVSLEVFLDASDIETDISGFHFQELPRLNQRIARAARASTPLLSATMIALRKTWKAKALSTLCIAAPLAALPFQPLLSIFGSVTAFIAVSVTLHNAIQFSKEALDDLTALKKELERTGPNPLP